MVLLAGNTLETIISAEDDIQVAIETLADKVEADSISPVIEQQLDPESYESTSYSIDVNYKAAEYRPGKNYYELVKDGETIGASMTTVCSAYEHEFLEQAQEIASNLREGDNTNHPFVESQVDMRHKNIKDEIKTASLSLWQLMYDGKLRFN